MFDLLIRILLLTAASVVTWLFHPSQVSHVGQFCAFWATIYLIDWILGRREMRTDATNSFVALADVTALSVGLAHFHFLGLAGVTVSVPVLILAFTRRSPMAKLSPLVLGIVLSVANLYHIPLSSLDLLANAAFATLLVALLGNSKRREQTAEEFEVAEEWVPDALQLQEESAHLPMLSLVQAQVENDGYQFEEPSHDFVELRENFRRLKEHAQFLEDKVKSERLATRLIDSLPQGTDADFAHLANLLRELCGARGLTIYSVSSTTNSLTVRVATGDVPYRVRTEMLSLDTAKSDVRLRAEALMNLRDSEDETPSAVILLKRSGSLVGMIWISCDHLAALNSARDQLEECSDVVGKWLHFILCQSLIQGRLAELDLLYSLQTVVEGSESTRALLSRATQELWGRFELDHLAISLVEDGELTSISTEGARIKILDAIRSENGMGVSAWIESGAPRVHVVDAHESLEIAADEAIRRRIGSLMVLPLYCGRDLYGVLTAATHRKGGVDPAQADRLRLLGSELSSALTRLQGIKSISHGLVTISEFQKLIATEEGSLVVLEPLKATDLLSTFGEDVLEDALNELALKLRPNLPVDGALCRRATDLIAFFPQMKLDEARRWANEAVGLSTLYQISLRFGGASQLLAIRGKATEISPKTPNNHHEITSSSPTLA